MPAPVALPLPLIVTPLRVVEVGDLRRRGGSVGVHPVHRVARPVDPHRRRRRQNVVDHLRELRGGRRGRRGVDARHDRRSGRVVETGHVVRLRRIEAVDGLLRVRVVARRDAGDRRVRTPAAGVVVVVPVDDEGVPDEVRVRGRIRREVDGAGRRRGHVRADHRGHDHVVLAFLDRTPCRADGRGSSGRPHWRTGSRSSCSRRAGRSSCCPSRRSCPTARPRRSACG